MRTWASTRVVKIGCVRSQVPDVSRRAAPSVRPVDAAVISAISDRQRWTTSRRCSASGTHSAPRWPTRTSWRRAANAEQHRAADAKLPQPSIGSSRGLMARWLCSVRVFRYRLHRCRTVLPRIQRIARRYGGCGSVVTRSGLRSATSTRRRRKRRAACVSRCALRLESRRAPSRSLARSR